MGDISDRISRAANVSGGFAEVGRREFTVRFVGQYDPAQYQQMIVAYHQGRYWAKVPGLAYERFVFRALSCQFAEVSLADLTALSPEHAVYAKEDYSAARALGIHLREQGSAGVQYYSVRNSGAVCWGLFSPQYVRQIVQCGHYEMIWQNGSISAINQIVSCNE